MAKYATASDNTDPAFALSELDLAYADSLVDALIANKGILPSEVAALAAVPALLTQLAVAYASEKAARDKAVTTNTLLLEKSISYAALGKRLEGQVSRLSLGLTTDPGRSGLGQITLGRR